MCKYDIFILDLMGLNRDGVFDIVTVLGDPKVESRQEQGGFLLYRMSGTILGPLSVSISVSTGLLSRG